MSTITVSIKWGKQTFTDVNIDLNDDIQTFKGQIYALSNVPVEKQKIMAKGKVLKDEGAWADYKGVV
jgi:ubiquitin carboxyl-terminal hydrolase 14